MVKKTSVRFEKPTAEIDNFEAPEADTSGDLRYVSREIREGKVKNARTERIRKWNGSFPIFTDYREWKLAPLFMEKSY